MPVKEPLLADPEVGAGATFGKYEVLRKLATGGMAEIFLARVRGIVGFEKLVVLKRILPNIAEDPAFVKMFLDEARLAATLQHPNIADVYDVGSEGKFYFFTMEFIHGADARTLRLQAHRTGKPIPLAHALAMIHGTASALAYAHDKAGPDGPLGLVHRDVSSSNILVSFDGAVKLVDFGIARATAQESKTRTGTLKGKIPYMSPEQCQNRPLDRRSDLFSLGVVLYELTVGRRPFRGDSDFEVLDQIINRGARAPSEIVQNYPPQLERIVMKLLARNANDRYQTAEDVVADLEEVMGAQGGWVSPMAMGKYMRSLFPDKVDAWQRAEQHGESLGEHVAQTITSESVKQELRHTPVSMAAQIEPVSSIRAAPATPAPSVQLPVALPTYQTVRSPWRWFPAVAAAIAIAAVLIALRVSGSSDDAPPARTAEPETVNVKADPAPAPPPKTEPVKPTEVVTTTPAPAPAAAPTRPAPAAPIRPVAKTVKPTRPIARPVKPVAAPKPIKQPPQPPKPPKPPKKDSWDPNSMYLPK